MKTPEEKYNNDPEYHLLVDTLLSMIISAKYTPSELREAAILASIKYETEKITMKTNFEYNNDIERAFEVFDKYIKGNNS